MLQDYSGQNLRGRNFKGQNLEGANFSGADIRGANFTGANLRGVKFIGVKAGQPSCWTITLLFASITLSGVVGFLFASSGIFREVTVSSGEIIELIYIPGWIALVVILLLFITLNWKGWSTETYFTLYFALFLLAIILEIKSNSLTGTLAQISSIVLAWVILLSILLTVAKMTGETIGLVGAGIVSFFGSVSEIRHYQITSALALIVVSLAIIFLSNFVIWQAFSKKSTDSLFKNVAIAITTIGSTSFYVADLTDADFTNAILKSTDFRKAILTRTCFKKTKKLDRVRPGTTYLQKAQVRQVLVTGQGLDLNFDREDLRGVNFQGANLVDASFIGADLSEANLHNADLSKAKLVQTQLDGTDFTGATLTGAFIEDWNITTDTKFDGVQCDYVYMRLPTQDNPDPHRKPDNRQEVFADGEFGDFIKPIFDTLDLYHSQGVDPRAIAISFKQLAENYPDAELEIVAMEKRGQDKFLLRAKTASTADKSELSAEYFETYNEIKALPEREIKLLLAEKDSRIQSLENFVNQALQRPSYYSNVEQVGTMTNNPGGFSVGGSVGGNVNNVQGDGNRAVQGDNNQAVLGDGNQVTQQNQVGADTGESLTKEDVVKLLAQLETLIQGAELPANTKEEVIEDLSAAKKATDKEEPNKQRALERLGTVAETLEKTSKGVEAGQKVWTIAKPIIVKVATWLGVAAGSHLLGL
ncbi:pentapeptide repeat-containing protein [Nostoc sp. UCD122]|nr:pentapeptide repeat-containing protein [Nostoc sp. UCD122]